MLNVLATNEAFSLNGSSVRIPIAARYRLKTNLFESPENNDEAERLQEKAKELREQIRKMEENLPAARGNKNAQYIPAPKPVEIEEIEGKSLKGKTVLVVGANGRLGSMVTRYLLRNHPEVKEVLASVHYVGQASSRGYGRLSYEVGAEVCMCLCIARDLKYFHRLQNVANFDVLFPVRMVWAQSGQLGPKTVMLISNIRMR